VGASPIGKYDLLKLISTQYKKLIDISGDETFAIDRSLNVDRFGLITGYRAPAWPELIQSMYQSREVLNV
jgi:dTDP-4-dehydrorhamnose reductase